MAEQVKRPNKKLPRLPIIRGLVVSVLMVRYETDYIVWSAVENHTDFLKCRKGDVTILFLGVQSFIIKAAFEKLVL